MLAKRECKRRREHRMKFQTRSHTAIKTIYTVVMTASVIVATSVRERTFSRPNLHVTRQT